MSWDDEFFACSVCGSTKCVDPCGPEKSSYIIIGSYPGEDEVKGGIPFSGKTGVVLKSELRKVGLDFASFRVTNLWKHLPNANPKCMQEGAEAAIAEAKGRQVVLLIGAEAVKFFCNLSVEGYNGLPVKSNYLSAPLIVACVQPTTVYHGGLGEIRLTIQKLSRKIEVLENER